jgi:aspartyl-tRNA(Asn)/glutamyl-tRNA(Gln) amidotransferase subunit C
MTKIDKKTVEHMAKLANIPVSDKEKKDLADGFNKTLDVVDNLFTVGVSGVEPTHQVTGLENVLREDEVKKENTFTQEEALNNTKRKHNGYFVVDQILVDD